ncbi:hypothetical protein NPIL_293561 [Nephila pilipes]|uniref:Uncharacterized protein n=1 Tax=Nephila pilipes TaxID=299642 RepID=A0A8X6TBE4_NEPPI|nr:hypothetical protein NPIL_293561 [Nephila pilipes]
MFTLRITGTAAMAQCLRSFWLAMFNSKKELQLRARGRNIKTDEGVQQTQTTRRSHKEECPGEEEDSIRHDTSRNRLQVGRRTGQPLLGKAPEGEREAMLLGGS